MNISFAHTIRWAKQLNVPDPLTAGIKTVTRRNWTDESFWRIYNQYDRGNARHDAWSNAPFVKGAGKIGEITLTGNPYHERLADIPVEDLYHEGNLWRTKQEFIDAIGMKPGDFVVVLRFEFVPLPPQQPYSFDDDNCADYGALTGVGK